MLAYVFWHWRGPAVGETRYEELLRAFHASLAGNPPPGFLRSAALAVAGAPWMPASGYEDWYGVRGFADFDALNEKAIAPPHAAAHDAVAHVAGGGAGGVYRLRLGEPHPGRIRFAHWFGKPLGMPYADLDRLLEPFVGAGRALWMRQMVLGPSPEFCLQASEPLALPEELAALSLPLRPIWPQTNA